MSIGIKLTTEEFIEKARKVHGDKYDYSKVEYINYCTKVEIICKEHGPFWQISGNHLFKNGCPKCADNIKLTTKEFVKRSKDIHKNKYGYDKTIYVNRRNKVKIFCKEHGIYFYQFPKVHLNGSGCNICAGERVAKSTGDRSRMSRKDFIKKSINVHNNKYDYSKVEYIGCNVKIIIICKRHGEFKQVPSDHIRGAGCPYCFFKGEGQVKDLLFKYFFEWEITKGKKIWDEYKNYKHRRYCDFWLKKDNIKIIVEYDGEGHFMPVCFNGISFKKAEKGFKRTQLKDKLDAQFCKENNIILHRIKYDQDKEKSIKELFKKVG